MALIGDESLICRNEKDVYDLHCMTIIQGNVVVGHAPQNVCGFFWKFLSMPKNNILAMPNTICTRVLGKRFNRSAEYDLEIPVCFVFQGHVKGVEWIKKTID